MKGQKRTCWSHLCNLKQIKCDAGVPLTGCQCCSVLELSISVAVNLLFMQSDGCSGSSIGDWLNVGTLILSLIELPLFWSTAFWKHRHSYSIYMYWFERYLQCYWHLFYCMCVRSHSFFDKLSSSDPLLAVVLVWTCFDILKKCFEQISVSLSQDFFFFSSCRNFSCAMFPFDGLRIWVCCFVCLFVSLSINLDPNGW